MSGLPTLLKKNYVVAPKWMNEVDKKKLENTVSIEYILKFIGDRIPNNTENGLKIKVPPKKFGDKVIVLKSDTGSGKSTVLPAKLYEVFNEVSKKNIAVTQPRVLTAVDTPNIIVSVPNNSFLKLDKNIGYTTEAFKRLPSDVGIIFSTVGVIAQQLIHFDQEVFMNRYQFIIIDEVHERDTSTDLCLFLLKKLLENNWENPNCPLVILASATFDETIFMNYFDCPIENYIQVIGKTFPIEPRFPKYNIKNVVKYATELAKKIHIENLSDLKPDPETGKINKYRDIMIFVHDTNSAVKIYEDLLIFNSTVLTDPNESNLSKKLIDINNNLDKLSIKSAH